MTKRELPVISLFSGALGLDLGLERAGFRIRVAVDCNRFAAETIRRNRPEIPVINRPIEKVSTAEILEAAGLRAGEPAVITGGPSCQAFSTAGQRGSLSDPRGVMFREFLRVVREARPRFFVMENVRGVLSAAVQHRPLGQRGPGYPPLMPEEELGSAFRRILKELKRLNYYVVFDLLNAADFGVPQVRERVIFIGSRNGELVACPAPTHARHSPNGKPGWVTLHQALKGLRDAHPEFVGLLEKQKKYLKMIPEGGNWRDLPARLRAPALGKAYKSWGGRVGFLRRLAWDRPAPALTTRPNSRATMLCHPDELRPLTVREYARLQQFPSDWEFDGGTPQQYIQIGNAVPVGLGQAIGEAVRHAMAGPKHRADRGAIVCSNEGLLTRLAKRPTTVLNPIRMRKVKTPGAAAKWLSTGKRNRADLLRLINSAHVNGRTSRSAETRRSKAPSKG